MIPRGEGSWTAARRFGSAQRMSLLAVAENAGPLTIKSMKTSLPSRIYSSEGARPGGRPFSGRWGTASLRRTPS
jgi:hypothetical protein